MLLDYAEHGSEPAFAELVRRHADLAYSAARRQVESPDQAGDVTQSVFTDLARKAGSIAPAMAEHASLAGWLYRGVRLAALGLRRQEQRRRSRETQAMETQKAGSAPEPDWDQLRPVLDEAMEHLSEPDHDALLLRFFQNQSLRSVGAALGVSDDTAQKRVARALEKLREELGRRGVTASAGTLTVALSLHAVSAAPPALITGLVAATTLPGLSVPAVTTLAVAQAMAMTTLQKTLIVAVLAAAAGAGLYEARQAGRFAREARDLRAQQAPLASQIRQLEQERDAATNRLAALLAKQSGPRLPAPRARATAPAPEIASDTVQRLLRDENPPRLTAAQAESYLGANRRNAGSLLAAFRATGDAALLEEAMRKHPNDPQVAFAAVFKENLGPEERRQWLEKLKETAPDNPLASYLSARDYFQSGQNDQALRELAAAAGKSQFQDYAQEASVGLEEAYRAAGYGEAEAKTISSLSLSLPHLVGARDLSGQLMTMANSYREAGDPASAMATLQMGVRLGQQVGAAPGNSLVAELTGLSIERISLGGMDPNLSWGAEGQTVQNRITQLQQQRASVRDLAGQFAAVQAAVQPADWVSYKNRWHLFGEEAAIRWLVGKYAPQP